MSHSIAQQAIKEAREATIGKSKAAQSWDEKMTLSEKKIILLGARLSESLAQKKWKELTAVQSKNICEATYRLSRWAADLGLVAGFEAEVEE